MKLTIQKKSAPLIFLLGTLCILASASIAYINRGFGILPISIGVTGILLLALSFMLLGKFLRIFFLNTRFADYAKAGLVIIFALIILIAFNYFTLRYDIRWDATDLKQHTITPTTRDLIKNLSKDITITVLHTGLPPKYIEDILNEYSRLSSGKIKTEIIDPLVQISYAAQFGNKISGDEKRAIVQCGSERHDIDFRKTQLNEAFLTNAIIKSTRNKRNVYFITGHGEYDIEDKSPNGLDIFNRLLENNNCTIKKLMLGITKSIPADCDLLIIAGPENSFIDSEEELVQKYLKEGGKALFFIESNPVGTKENPLSQEDKKKNPALNGILNYWGIHIGNDVVVDIENYIGGDVGSPATKNYPPHKSIIGGLDYTFYIRPRSINGTTPGSPDIKFAPLVFSSSSNNSWAETDEFLNVKFDEDKDVKGPVAIAAVIWGPKNDQRSKDTKIIVFTDTDFVSNDFIAQYSNAAIVLNSVGWLTELDNIMPIEEKKEDDAVERFEITSKQTRIVVVILFAIPALIAGMGIIVWWKRNAI